MGLDESKLSQSNKSSHSSHKLCAFAPLIPWRVVHQCSLDLWRKSHRDNPMICSYQFPYDCTSAFCLSRQNIINFRKACPVFSMRKRRKSTKMADHFEYNHIPAYLSSIQSVLAMHNGLAVVQLARNRVTQFAVVDLKINKFLGSFGRQPVSFSPHSTIGKISPDGTLCLIRLPCAENRRIFVLKVYNLRNCELISELPLRFAPVFYDNVYTPRAPLSSHQEVNRQDLNHQNRELPQSTRHAAEHNLQTSVNNENPPRGTINRSTQVLFAFDPRFLNSRIAITNVVFPSSSSSSLEQYFDSNNHPSDHASVSLVKLPTWECLKTTTKIGSRPSINLSQNHTSSFIPTISANVSSRYSSGNTSASNPNQTRDRTRRRRSSEVNNAAATVSNFNPINNHTTPHILSIFFSRDGYLLFTVSTDTRGCRCSAIGNSSTSSTQCSLNESAGSSDDLAYSTATSGRSPTRIPSRNTDFNILSDTSVPSHSSPALFSPMMAPTLPGCTTLWLTIFDSDTLERLRVLRFDRAICPVHTCPTNYVPSMSRCGSRLALITRQLAYRSSSHSKSCLLSNTSTVAGGGSNGCKLLSSSLRHSIPSINVEFCQDYELMHNRTSECRCPRSNPNIPITSNSHQRSTPSSTLPSMYASCGLFKTPRNLNLSCHLSTSLPSPLSGAHFTATGIPGASTCPHCTYSGTADWTGSHRHAQTPFENVLPIASSSSARQVEVLMVYQLPPPPKLQALVRQKIRQLCREDQLEYLDVPPRIISYLRFHPSYTCAGSCLSRSSSSNRTVRSDSLDF